MVALEDAQSRPRMGMILEIDHPQSLGLRTARHVRAVAKQGRAGAAGHCRGTTGENAIGPREHPLHRQPQELSGVLDCKRAPDRCRPPPGYGWVMSAGEEPRGTEQRLRRVE